jgi:hypothetical protein
MNVYIYTSTDAKYPHVGIIFRQDLCECLGFTILIHIHVCNGFSRQPSQRTDRLSRARSLFARSLSFARIRTDTVGGKTSLAND